MDTVSCWKLFCVCVCVCTCGRMSEEEGRKEIQRRQGGRAWVAGVYSPVKLWSACPSSADSVVVPQWRVCLIGQED